MNYCYNTLLWLNFKIFSEEKIIKVYCVIHLYKVQNQKNQTTYCVGIYAYVVKKKKSKVRG